MTERPYPKTWWVEEGSLLAGCYPGDMIRVEAERKLTALLDLGIRAVICLQEEDERGYDGGPFVPYEPVLKELANKRGIEVDCRRFPIRDYGVPSIETMKTILDAIDGCMSRGMAVYVHCWGGHGRTGTVVGCWLVRHGMTGEQALEEIERLRRQYNELRGWPSPQAPDQISMVEYWKTGQ
ncbi:MAG TPA: protein phosphatase [Candidatus Brocadiia bacterium]|nr:protein phosphatase [Candidatus Brocadiia bacterium]